MLPVTFDQQNFVFKKPHEMTDEECGDLPVWRGPVGEFPGIISCWRFSKEDLEEIQKTGCIWLMIAGAGMPPVSLFTENPFTQPVQSDVQA